MLNLIIPQIKLHEYIHMFMIKWLLFLLEPVTPEIIQQSRRSMWLVDKPTHKPHADQD